MTRAGCAFLRATLAVALAAVHVAAFAVPGSAQNLDCLIEANTTVAVAFPVDGLVETVKVDRGDLVTAGQVLATLESSVEKASGLLAKARAEVQSALRSNQVRVDFGARRFARTDEMYQKNLVPLKELDEAETTKVLADRACSRRRRTRRSPSSNSPAPPRPSSFGRFAARSPAWSSSAPRSRASIPSRRPS